MGDFNCHVTKGSDDIVGHRATFRLTCELWPGLKPNHLYWYISNTIWDEATYISYFSRWLYGTTLFIHHTAVFNPKQILELLAEYPITTFWGAPTIYRMLVLKDLIRYDFTVLRHCTGVSEPTNLEIIEVWRKANGITIPDGYGQT